MRLITVCALSCLCISSSTSATPPAPGAAVRYEQIVQDSVSSKDFMGTVLIAKDGVVILNKGYGFADLEWNVANTPQTKFRLGSLTKQFTAASILLLEERGKLSVDDPVKRYLTDAPPAWDKVTITQLLNHTSGIPSFTDFPDYRSTEAQPTTPEALVARFKNTPLDFEPGTQWKYSNSGYVLLGYLLEKVSSQKYEDFVDENIFKKLGMSDSGYDSSERIIPNHAHGYVPTEKGIVHAGYIDMTIPFSAGSLYSTTGDLLKWEQGLFGNKVVSPASLKKMTTPYKENYGFGLQIGTLGPHQVIEHGGGIEGFNTRLRYFPDDKTVIVVLANLNGMAADQIAARLGTVSQGGSVTLPSERKAISLSDAVLAKYVGVYAFDADYKIELSIQGSQLFAQLTGQPKAALFAEAVDKFFFKVADAQITFAKNAKGEIDGLVIHQDGQDHAAKRVAAGSTAK